MKPIFDRIIKGTPVRPFRSAYPNNRSYEVHSNSKNPRKTSLFGRSGLSTNITSAAGSDSRSGGNTGSAINLRDIRVERGVEIDRFDRESVRNSETRGNEVV